MKIFHERLNELMEDKNITQKALAKTIGSTQQSISRYQRGERTPDIDTLAALVKVFEVSADYLLGLENEDGSKNY